MPRIIALASALALLPAVASADVLPRVAGLFNVFVGLMLTAAFLSFGTGTILWAARLGTYPTYRDEGIRYMMWGVVVLFVLVILLAVVQFVQHHAAAAAFLFGVVVLILAGWMVLTVATAKEEKKEEH